MTTHFSLNHLKNRSLGKKKNNLVKFKDVSKDLQAILILNEDDLGVRLNGGRAGARFAPQSILNQFSQLIDHHQKKVAFETFKPLWSVELESYARDQASKLSKSLNNWNFKSHPLIQIGGGHDHIFTLLNFVRSLHKGPIVVFNIDAHCDTRDDPLLHSGTPFRRFASQNSDTQFHLIQLGIHDYTNNPSTLEPLGQNATMKIYSQQEIEDSHGSSMVSLVEKYLSSLNLKDPFFIFSLDLDGLHSHTMEAVSAVNHDGLQPETVHEFLNWFQMQPLKKVYGLYEYNPLLDNLSNKGSRYVASLLQKIIG